MKETFARIFAIILLVGGTLSIGFAWWLGQTDTITLHARMPEAGGWTPADLTVTAGQPLHLRLTSDDVMHGFAIGQSDQPAVDVKPGEMTDLSLMFDQPGTYTFYCTRWCGPTTGACGERSRSREKWRNNQLHRRCMRSLDWTSTPRTKRQVVPSKSHLPNEAQSLAIVLSLYQSERYYRSHSPEQAWQDLRDNLELASFSDQQLWDAVASIWQSHTTPEALAEAKQLYARNCAACHGESGGGDSIFSSEPSSPKAGDEGEMPSGHETVGPSILPILS